MLIYYSQVQRLSQLLNIFLALIGWFCYYLFDLIVGLAIDKA